MTTRRFLISACSLALLAAAACSTDAEKDAVLNACSMLDEKDIAAAVGSDVTPGERNDAGLITDGPEAGIYSSTCVWRIRNGASPDTGASLQQSDYVILNAMRWPADKDPETFLQAFRDFAAQGVISHRPVSLDIGDSALWWGDGVAVVKDRLSFGISVRLVGQREKRRGLEEALARTVAAHL